jgi:hypothetical protein
MDFNLKQNNSANNKKAHKQKLTIISCSLKELKEFKLRRLLAAATSLHIGTTIVSQYTGFPIYVIRYWQQKLMDDNFHPNSHGGKRFVFVLSNLLIYF